jgi:hypothetical protein
MILLDHVVQILHAPELSVIRHNLLFLRSAECLRISRILIYTDGEWQAAGSALIIFLKNRFAAETSRFALSINSIVNSIVARLSRQPDKDTSV